jgi:hypothetical protein
MPPEFEKFPKMARLSRECIITEKIDGTNAQVCITEDGQLLAGSRTRWIAVGKQTDNHGFAAWCQDNVDELMKLGPGRHYGEWWGKGIQRGYGLDHNRFSLFNVARWGDDAVRPKCCYVVPQLYRGPFDTEEINETLWALQKHGSYAVSHYFGNPEGIVVFHIAAGIGFKKTLENDEKGKPE